MRHELICYMPLSKLPKRLVIMRSLGTRNKALSLRIWRDADGCVCVCMMECEYEELLFARDRIAHLRGNVQIWPSNQEISLLANYAL